MAHIITRTGIEDADAKNLALAKRLVPMHLPDADIGMVKSGVGRTNFNYQVYNSKGNGICNIRVAKPERIGMPHFYFLQVQSLENDKYILEKIAKHSTVTPVPRILGEGTDPETSLDYLVVSYIGGKNFHEIASHLNQDDFNTVMRRLGEALIPISRILFNRYGQLGPNGTIQVPFDRWSDRIAFAIYGKLSNPALKEYFDQEFLVEKIPRFVEQQRGSLDGLASEPRMVVYDLHPRNFNVTEDLQIAGFFDVGLGLSAHRTLEFIPVELNVANFGKIHRPDALEAFFEGYRANSEVREAYSATRSVHAFNHFLGAVLAYHNNPKDELGRETWSREVFAPRCIDVVERCKVDMVRWF